MSPKDRVGVVPLPNGRNLWFIHRGDPNQLLNGIILQVMALHPSQKTSKGVAMALTNPKTI